MLAFLYVRVSTSGQAIDGVSLEAQEARGRAWAIANGYEVAGLFSDTLSGKRAENREGLQAALDAACAGRGALVVYSLSRLARSTKDAISIGERLGRVGADLVSVTEHIDTTTAAGKMVFRMLAVLAEFERDLVSERTSTALQFKRHRGERVGQVPFGSRLATDGVHLENDDEERAVLQDMVDMRRGGWSWRRIADELNQRGVSTKTGRTWTWQTARKVGRAAA